MKIPICQRVFQYFCHFFIFSGPYQTQCAANAVFCAFCAVWGGIFIPPEYRLSAPAPQLGRPVSATTAHPPASTANRKSKRFMPIRFFFCIYRRKRKSYQKENAERRFRALRSATRTPRPRPRKPLKRLERNFNWWRKLLRCVQKNLLLARRFFKTLFSAQKRA